jgi:hypothetical protein
MAGIATPLYSACSPSGRIVMTSWGDPARQPARAEMKPGTAVSYATWSRIWIMDTSGAVLTEFPDTIIAERIQHLSSGGGGGSGPHMFGRNVSFVMDSSHLIMSYGDRLELSHYSFDGKLRAIWRALADDLELTEAMVKQYESAKLAPADSEERAYYLPRFTLTYPSTYPAFDKLFLTPSGYVWARRFRLPWEEGYRWGVFEPEGRFLGYTELPRGLEVFQIDDDYVTGVAKDSLDVPFVQLHEVALRGSR